MALANRRREVVYAAILIAFIPLSITFGALWLTSQVKAGLDQELRTKANLANEIFGVQIADALATGSTPAATSAIQALLDQTMSAAPEIDNLSVSIPTGGAFRTIASSNPADVGLPDTSIQTTLAASKQTPIASLIEAGEAGDREWLVATPITGPEGGVLAVSTIWVSLRQADSQMASTLTQTAIGLAILDAVIILLLTHHFRLVQYAELFRQQKELDQMKDDFISIATHELKAPMTLIKGYLSMALELRLAKEPKTMIQIAFDQTDRLGRLVTDLLDVSRIEQGRAKYNLVSVDLPKTITPLLGTFEVKAHDKKLHLRYDTAPDVPPVFADPDRVSEVFTNLIDNAIKYSRHGTVTISHTTSQAYVTTIVADTGIGMTRDEQSRLFQRFYRARNDDTKDIAGTGLGLWIIKQYIEHMNGSIVVRSVKGHGTSILVTLPRIKSEK